MNVRFAGNIYASVQSGDEIQRLKNDVGGAVSV
jgi:hypothetical protein